MTILHEAVLNAAEALSQKKGMHLLLTLHDKGNDIVVAFHLMKTTARIEHTL